MDRKIVWPGAIPLETDLLGGERNAMVGLGLLAQDVLGTTTVVGGLPCTQTTVPSMQVQVGGGRIYQVANLDSTAFSSLSADTAHQLLKQGINLDPTLLSCPAPTTVGFSINYLVEATFTESDTDAVVLPYYNAANPSVAFSGPNNTGVAQATRRAGVVALVAKAGVAAATGSQVTPAVDSGYVPLYVVTVAYGATSVVNANISVAGGAPFLSATLAGALTSAVAAATYQTLAGMSSYLTTAAAASTYLAASSSAGTKAWAKASGTTGTIGASLNVASLTRTATGKYTVVMTTAMTDANYAVLTNDMWVTANFVIGLMVDPGVTKTTTTFGLLASNTGGAVDPTEIYFSVIR